MTIVTSSWFTKLDPTQYARIGISRGVPRGQRDYRRYRTLEPGPWFNSVADAEYERRYYREILNRLDPARVVADLEEIAQDKIATLLCWECPAPGAPFCHRAHVSAWLFDTLGLEVFEVGQDGCGHGHPKLAPSFQEQGDLNLGGRPKDDRPPRTRT